MIKSSDGGFAMAGVSNSDTWLVKTDSSGNTQWNKTYGGTSSDIAYSVVQTSDGGYALAGTLHLYSNTHYFWLIKTDPNGISQWNRTYVPGTSTAYSVVQTSGGGYALAGSTASFTAGSSDSWLVKTYAKGSARGSGRLALQFLQRAD
jgi:hypothetical protein